MQVAAEPELNERVVVEAADGDSAPPRFFDDRAGRGAEPRRFVQIDSRSSMIASMSNVFVGDARAHDPHRVAHRSGGRPVPPRRSTMTHQTPSSPDGTTRPKETSLPMSDLQLERDVLEDVRDVRPFLQPLDESARPSARALVQVERRHRARSGGRLKCGISAEVSFLERAEPHIARDDRREAPVIRTAKRPDARDFELGSGRGGSILLTGAARLTGQVGVSAYMRNSLYYSSAMNGYL